MIGFPGTYLLRFTSGPSDRDLFFSPMWSAVVDRATALSALPALPRIRRVAMASLERPDRPRQVRLSDIY